MIKTKVAFLEGRLFSAIQGFLKTIQIVLIGWIKAGPPKSHFCFDHVYWLNINNYCNVKFVRARGPKNQYTLLQFILYFKDHL